MPLLPNKHLNCKKNKQFLSFKRNKQVGRVNTPGSQTSAWTSQTSREWIEIIVAQWKLHHAACMMHTFAFLWPQVSVTAINSGSTLIQLLEQAVNWWPNSWRFNSQLKLSLCLKDNFPSILQGSSHQLVYKWVNKTLLAAWRGLGRAIKVPSIYYFTKKTEHFYPLDQNSIVVFMQMRSAW